MGRVDRYPHGTFCWVDLGTPDVDGAKRFYGELLGWQFDTISADGLDYTLCRISGMDVTGIHQHPEDDAVPAHWDSYIWVDDLDRTIRRARELGATIAIEAVEVPGVTRIGVAKDPAGAQVCFWQGQPGTGAHLVNEPGTWTWNDLSSRDPSAAERFYQELFGWKFTWPVPTYASISLDDLLVGGMRTMEDDPPETPSAWFPYFVTRDIEGSAGDVDRLGGAVIVPPREVPAGRFLVMRDPGGSVSGLIEMGPGGPARGVDRLGGR